MKIIKNSPSHQIENFQISVKPVFEELLEGYYICMRKFWILEENSVSNGHCDVKRVNFSKHQEPPKHHLKKKKKWFDPVYDKDFSICVSQNIQQLP